MYFDGCYFDGAYFNASVCVAPVVSTGHLAYWFTPPPNWIDPDEEEAKKKRKDAFRKMLAMIADLHD